MKPFRFCPACGSALPDFHEETGSQCSSCGRIWYRNAAPTAGAVVLSGERALVTIRAREPMKGKVDIVGGFLRPDEDPIQGLLREVAEEIGVEIEVTYDDFPQAAPHTYGDEGDWVLALGFKARLVRGEPAPSDDVAAVRWISAEDVDDLDWAWPHDRELVRKALANGIRPG
jgi:NADH pyrophosphatase NudC (nudix superfamily)